MLNPKQQEFIEIYFEAGNVSSTCEKIGINRSTYYKWLKTDEFKKEFEAQQELIYNSSLYASKGLYARAMDEYEKLLNSDNDAVKLKVIVEILKNADSLMREKRYLESRIIYGAD